jgi:hypothetical protein
MNKSSAFNTLFGCGNTFGNIIDYLDSCELCNMDTAFIFKYFKYTYADTYYNNKCIVSLKLIEWNLKRKLHFTNNNINFNNLVILNDKFDTDINTFIINNNISSFDFSTGSFHIDTNNNDLIIKLKNFTNFIFDNNNITKADFSTVGKVYNYNNNVKHIREILLPILFEYSYLWTEINMNLTEFKEDDIIILFNKINKKLININLNYANSRIHIRDNDYIIQLINKCNNIQVLELFGFHNIDNNIMEEIVIKCPNIHSISLSHVYEEDVIECIIKKVKNLRELKLSCITLSDNLIESLIEYSSNIELLSIRNFGADENFEDDIDDDDDVEDDYNNLYDNDDDDNYHCNHHNYNDDDDDDSNDNKCYYCYRFLGFNKKKIYNFIDNCKKLHTININISEIVSDYCYHPEYEIELVQQKYPNLKFTDIEY